MTQVLRRHDPPGAPIPLVLDSPHSGEWYPDDFDHAPPRALVRQAEDTHVARLWSHAPAHGATLIEALLPARLHRCEPQPGRHRPGAARGRVAGPDRAVAQDRSSASGSCGGSRAAACRCTRGKLASDEVRSRIERCWRPYHAALDAALDERHRRVRRASGTSTAIRCSAVGDALSDDPGRERADFVLGDRDGTTCEPAFTQLVARDAARGWATAWRSTIRTRASSSCASTAGPPSSGTACRSRSSARCTWTSRRSQPNAGYARLQRDLDRAAGGARRASCAARRPRWPDHLTDRRPLTANVGRDNSRARRRARSTHTAPPFA